MPIELNLLGALDRIGGHIRETPIVRAGDPGILLKCEHRQVTGSFKARGALNKILGLTSAQRQAGVVAASAGNHGLGVAFAAKIVDARATIVVPDDAVKTKVEGIRGLGAEVIEVPGGFGAAEAQGLSLAHASGAVWVSPYNDLDVIEGQGTLGLEIADQWRRLVGGGEGPTVYIPVSGGGLICGVGLAMKRALPGVRVIGVQTAAAPYMAVYLEGGDPMKVVETPTIADGLAGPVEHGSVTFDLLTEAADEIRLVNEDEIMAALKAAWEMLGEVVEPSAAVPLAAAMADETAGSRVVVLSGGNTAASIRAQVARKDAGEVYL